MARLGEIQLKSGVRDIDQVMNYLYQLEEQLRFALNNLDSENIRDGAISAEQLSGAVNARLSTLERAAERMGESGAEKLANENVIIDRSGVRLQNGAFSLDTAGKMKARALSFPDGEAARKTADSPDFRFHIGTEKPEEKDVLWIRPGTETNEGQLCQMYWIRKEEEA